jgi:hypothetical protein
MNRMNQYPWRLLFTLIGGSFIGIVALIPYAVALSGDAVRQIPVPLPILLVLQVVQSTVFLGVAAGIGLLVSRKVGLGAPVLEAWLYKRENLVKLRVFATSAIAGAIAGAFIVAIAYLVFHPLLPQLPTAPGAALPLWKRLLACFYGAVDEEILMRLFLLSLLLWLIGKFWHTSKGQPARGAFWTTNVLVALLFGLGHLPAASQIMPVNATTILYILSLNGIGSLLFGYLFWRRGLESAMIAHFFADVVLHVIAPVLQQ